MLSENLEREQKLSVAMDTIYSTDKEKYTCLFVPFATFYAALPQLELALRANVLISAP